ncbi:MAG: type 1 glutamine amidotransferase domain-containing protein [Candidatus Azobacteroides sp.]|nr:type 1 glutamine amidotransferase domain-containing protein [Candidatus Azobacteroides sp.]
MKKIIVGALIGGAAYWLTKKVKRKNKKGKKILFVVTSHGKLGHTNEHTGYLLSEVSHPWKVLTSAGYEIDFVSPHGGTPPVDGFELIEPVNRKFWNNQKYQKKILTSLRPEDINPDDYKAIFYAGGHGAMWDFPDNTELSAIATRIYEAGGIVAAVCHGPAGLLNIKLSDGTHLIEGKKATGFSNEEEELMKREHIVPFLLEEFMKKRKALFEKQSPGLPHVVVDGRLITGQNPTSAKGVGKKILEALKKE